MAGYDAIQLQVYLELNLQLNWSPCGGSGEIEKTENRMERKKVPRESAMTSHYVQVRLSFGVGRIWFSCVAAFSVHRPFGAVTLGKIRAVDGSVAARCWLEPAGEITLRLSPSRTAKLFLIRKLQLALSLLRNSVASNSRISHFHFFMHSVS